MAAGWVKDMGTKNLGSFCVYLDKDLTVCMRLELLYDLLDTGSGPCMVKVLVRLSQLLLATPRTGSKI